MMKVDNKTVSIPLRITELLQEYGNFKTMGEALGVDPSYLGKLHRKKATNPSDEILLALGLKRKHTYHRIKFKTPKPKGEV